MKFASLSLLSALAMASAVSLSQGSILIDDFSTTTLSPAYTQTTVLDNNNTRDVSFQSPSGTLQGVYASGTTNSPEQTLLLRNDFSLGVGQILRADVAVVGTGLSQDLAIAVSATATPTVTTLTNGPSRSDYFYAGFRGDATHFISSGFNGTAGIGTNQAFGLTLTGLFIKRDSSTQFEVGYNSNGGPDVTAFTYNFTNPNIGNAVGFYTDERAPNTVGNLDNLRLDAVPEPASIGLLAVGAAGLLARRRR